jgi:hypothetical protein
VPVKITSFDEMMYVLGEKLDYPLLNEQITKIAVDLSKVYEDQISEVVEETKTDKSADETSAGAKKVVAEAITKLVVKTWWEVVMQVKKTNDIDEKEVLYLAGIKKFFKDYFLLQNYANYLSEFRKDQDKAEIYYKKALAVNPDEPNNNGKYPGFLLGQGRKKHAISFLVRAEKSVKAKKMEIRLHFYRLAHLPKTAEVSRKAIQELLEQGVRLPGWDFSRNIEQAEQDGCPYVEELRELAKKNSEVE